MDNTDIDLIRKKYYSLNLEKKRIQNIKDRILELESDPKVKEYLTLVGLMENYDNIKLEEKFYDDADIIIKETEDSNKILFSYGYFPFHIRNIGCKKNLYVYRDLETTKLYYLTTTNKIEQMPFYFAFLPNNNYSERKEFSQKDKEFVNLRRYFIEQIINRPQEEVVEELLKNNKQLVKGK